MSKSWSPNTLQHDLLTESETRRHIARAKEGDNDAIAALLKHNERLVFKICSRYHLSGATGDETLDDLMQEGRMGIMHAIRKFDLSRPEKFSTYAVYWIRHYVSRHGIRNGMTIAVSYSAIEKRGRALRARASLEATLERAPTISEVASEAEVTSAIASSLDYQIVSIDQAFNVGDSEGFEAGVESDETFQVITRIIKGLPDLQRDVLCRYCRGQTQEEISQAIGRSPHVVRLLKNQAIQKIRLTIASLNS